MIGKEKPNINKVAVECREEMLTYFVAKLYLSL